MRAASAARGTAEGGYIVDGTSDEGSDDNKAAESAARRAYASAASDNDEAVATAERHACAAMAARHADGRRLRQRRPSGCKVTASAARRTRTTKAARRTGVGEAASNAKGDDVASRDDDSDVDAHDDTNNDAKGAGQPKKVGEYGGRGVCATTAPYDSDDDPDSSVNKAATPRATDKTDEAKRDGSWRGCAASARKSAGRQAKARAAHHNHDTDNDDYDVDAAGGRKSEARCRAARKRRYSPQDFNTYDGADEEGRETEAGEGTPKVAYAKAASGGAAQARTATPSPTTRPPPRPIRSKSPAKRHTPRQTGAGARTPDGQEITP